jgi:hypothetical protein
LTDERAKVRRGALLTAGDKVTRKLVREIEDGMADRAPSITEGLSPLVGFFVAACDLRQAEGGVLTYYHPCVEKGVENARRCTAPRQANGYGAA